MSSMHGDFGRKAESFSPAVWDSMSAVDTFVSLKRIFVSDDVSMIQELFDGGVDLGRVTLEMTPLMMSCRFKAKKCALKLLELGYDVNAGVGHRFPINCLVEGSDLPDAIAADMLSCMIRHTVDVRKGYHYSPLYCTVWSGAKLCTLELISAGASVLYRDECGNNLLHVAAKRLPDMEVVRSLVSAGADLYHKDWNSLSAFRALMNAAQKLNLPVLLEYLNTVKSEDFSEQNDDDADSSGNTSYCEEKSDTCEGDELPSSQRLLIDHLREFELHRYEDLLRSQNVELNQFVRLREQDILKLGVMEQDVPLCLEAVTSAYEKFFRNEALKDLNPRHVLHPAIDDLLQCYLNMVVSMKKYRTGVEIMKAALEEPDVGRIVLPADVAKDRNAKNSVYQRGNLILPPEDLLSAIELALIPDLQDLKETTEKFRSILDPERKRSSKSSKENLAKIALASVALAGGFLLVKSMWSRLRIRSS